MLRRSIIVVVLAALVVGCEKKPEIPKEQLAATVNGVPITKESLEKSYERQLARYRTHASKLPPNIEPRIRTSVLRRLIDEELVEQKAKDLGISLAAEVVEEEFAERKKRFRTENLFQEYINRTGNTVEGMKEDIQRDLLRKAVVDKIAGETEVTDAEIADYFAKNRDRYAEREQVKVSRILLRTLPKEEASARAEKRKAAESVRKQAAAEKADFAALARKHSQGTHAARGGELGWLTRGRMPAKFDEVAFGLEAGQVSAVFETPQGFEIVKVLEKREERKRPLEEVRASVENTLKARKLNEKRREVLRDIRNGAKVEMLVSFDEAKDPTKPAPVSHKKDPAPAEDEDAEEM